MRHRKVTDPQLALANAALDMASSAVGLKRSFRRHAVTSLSRDPRTNAARVAGPGRIFYFSYQLSAFSF
jgi:hypothetical protein